jgi:hypothetical protein
MHARTRFLLVALCVSGSACMASSDRRTPGTTNPGTGGSSSTGGSAATGGSPATGGSVGSTGGTGSGGTGGSTATGGSIGSDSDAGAPAASDGGATASDAAVGGPGLPAGPLKVVLLYSSDHNAADPSLKDMMAILSSLKDQDHLDVSFVLDSAPEAKATALKDKQLIIIGPNTRACSNGVDTAIKDLEVPLIVSKDCTSWTGLANMQNTPNTLQALKIVKSDHPLAAGLSGDVRVYTDNVCREVRGGGLGPDAIKIANTPVDANTWAIFAYEKGGVMAGGFKAPAKRVGFFWHRPSGGTPEGKKLFQAAVEWALTP